MRENNRWDDFTKEEITALRDGLNCAIDRSLGVHESYYLLEKLNEELENRERIEVVWRKG